MPQGTPEGVDLARLRPFFAAHVPGATDQPLTAELIAGGRSNLTYAISDGQHTWVLRRPPLGHVLPTAHDMAREYRVITALNGTAVPVPRPVALCADPSVVGAPFYLMDYVDGAVLRTSDDAGVLAPGQAGLLSQSFVDMLARIH